MSEPTSTKLEPTLTSLRELSKAFPDSSRRAALLLEAADVIEGLEREYARLQDARDVVFEDAKEIAAQLCDARTENAKLRELVWDLYCLAYPSAVEWEVSDEAYDKYSPCKKCHELHGGKSPCASATKDMTEECCAPIQAVIVADRMRELGIEVEQ